MSAGHIQWGWWRLMKIVPPSLQLQLDKWNQSKPPGGARWLCTASPVDVILWRLSWTCPARYHCSMPHSPERLRSSRIQVLNLIDECRPYTVRLMKIDEVRREQGGKYIYKIMSRGTIFGWLFRRKAMAFAGLELDVDIPGFVYIVASWRKAQLDMLSIVRS